MSKGSSMDGIWSIRRNTHLGDAGCGKQTLSMGKYKSWHSNKPTTLEWVCCVFKKTLFHELEMCIYMKYKCLTLITEYEVKYIKTYQTEYT